MDILKKQVVVLVCFFLFVGFLFLVKKSLDTPRPIPPVSYTFKPAPRKSGYALVNDNKESANFTSYVAKSGSAFTPSARFEVKDSSVDFSLAGSQGKTGFKKSDGAVTWENSFPSTDVTFQIKADGLSQEIIIKDRSAAAKAIKDREKYLLTLSLEVKNLIPRRNMEGNLVPVFMDAKTKEYRLHFPTPVLVDAKGQVYPISYSLSSAPHILILGLPREWITDASRAFPLRVKSGVFHNREKAFGE
jgi:hypothetical protein